MSCGNPVAVLRNDHPAVQFLQSARPLAAAPPRALPRAPPAPIHGKHLRATSPGARPPPGGGVPVPVPAAAGGVPGGVGGNGGHWSGGGMSRCIPCGCSIPIAPPPKKLIATRSQSNSYLLGSLICSSYFLSPSSA